MCILEEHSQGACHTLSLCTSNEVSIWGSCPHLRSPIRTEGMHARADCVQEVKPVGVAPRPNRGRSPLAACLRELAGGQHRYAPGVTAQATLSTGSHACCSTQDCREHLGNRLTKPLTKDHQRRPDGSCMPPHRFRITPSAKNRDAAHCQPKHMQAEPHHRKSRCAPWSTGSLCPA